MPLHLVRSSLNNPFVVAENGFLCLNDLNEPVSSGYIIQLQKKEIFPDRPLNLYMHISNITGAGPVIGRDLLLGALMATSSRIRTANRNVPMRLFTKLNCEDSDSISFYKNAGFDVESSFQELCEIQIPATQSTRQLGCICAVTPLRTINDLNNLYTRMQRTQRTPDDYPILRYNFEQQLCWPFYVAIPLGNTIKVVGEAIFFGDKKGNAVLHSLYVNSPYRSKGLEQAVMAYAMKTLTENREIHRFYAYRETIIPCEKEIASTSANVIRRTRCYPERLYG